MLIGNSSLRRILTVVTTFAVIFVIYVAHQSDYFTTRYATHISYFQPEENLLAQQGQFWQAFSKDLKRYGPATSPLTHVADSHLDVFYEASDHRSRPDLLRLNEWQLPTLRASHQLFVGKLKEREYVLPYREGTRGIVTTAGGSYLVIAMVSIRMLRQTGSTLPVEVWLASRREFDPEICGTILPSLNARCMVLQDIFDQNTSMEPVKIDKYQYKVMSIMFSSFEEVLFLDSDCFPIHDPNELFESEPFKSNGLILWPDFWFPSESPLFFEIAGIEPPAIWDRAATESGEILYSKKKHDLSIMLAAYYNYYGPEFFYTLQSQGAPGEGDKETFLWSAVALDNPYYKVRHPVHALGYWTKASEWRGSAMLQFDPTVDQRASKDINSRKSRPFFAHVNFPKLDPAQIFLENSFGAAGPTRDSDGSMRRIWHDSGEIAETVYGFDLEKILWREMKDIACAYEGTFQAWRGVADICTNATNYWETVFEDKDRTTQLTV